MKPPGDIAAGRGYTLLELLLVVGLVAALAYLVAGDFAAGGRAVELEAGQTTLVQLLTAARLRAQAGGRPVRLLVQADPASAQPARFRRVLVLQEETDPVGQPGVWTTVTVATLPAGVLVLPPANRIPAGLYAEPAAWRTPDGARVLASSALSAPPVVTQTDEAGPESWEIIAFGRTGGTSSSGFLVLAVGSMRPAGSFSAAESPRRAENPEAVRGIGLSSYGVPSLINHRAGF